MKTLFAACAAFLSFFAVPAAAGDIEYGEYLSSECVTCHRADATDARIPAIHGMDADGLAAIMKLYRAGEMENEAMRTVARRLTDEDIAALAVYFAAQPPPR